MENRIDPETVSSPPRRLWNRDFFLLWQGQLVSQVGNQAFFIAMMYWTMEATGSASLMGFLMMVSSLPTVLLGPLGGTIADRHSRRGIIVAADALRGVAVLVPGALLYWCPEAVDAIVATLFGVGALGGLVNAVFQPAISAAIPDLVPRDRVAAANSLNQFSVQGSLLAGQAAGGVLLRMLGAPVLILLDGVTYLFSAVSECFIRIPQRLPERSKGFGQTLRTYGNETLDGLRFVWQHPGMREVLLAATGLNFLTMPFLVLLPFFVDQFLGKGPEWYGFLLAAVGGGALTGFLLAGSLKLTGTTRCTLIVTALLGDTLILTSLGWVRNPAVALGLFFAGGILSGMVNIFVLTTLQVTTPGDMRGRVMALAQSIGGAASPLGMALGGILGDLTGKDIPLIYTGCGGMMMALTLVLSSRRRFREFLSGRGFEKPENPFVPPTRPDKH